jgi:hypothetical protein
VPIGQATSTTAATTKGLQLNAEPRDRRPQLRQQTKFKRKKYQWETKKSNGNGYTHLSMTLFAAVARAHLRLLLASLAFPAIRFSLLWCASVPPLLGVSSSGCCCRFCYCCRTRTGTRTGRNRGGSRTRAGRRQRRRLLLVLVLTLLLLL